MRRINHIDQFWINNVMDWGNMDDFLYCHYMNKLA